MNGMILGGSLFFEGLLSFFSPCVFPLIPLYMGYLTKDARSIDEAGNVVYSRGKTFITTLCFVLGICTVFVLAALGSSALHSFFLAHTYGFQLAGGILLVLFGLNALHVIEIPWLERTYMKAQGSQSGMNGAKAYLMGFFFSFAWSPCVGPMLAQAIVMAAQSSVGWVYIAAYALGFVSMFLVLGLFTSHALNLFKAHKNIVRFTGMAAGFVILAMGGYTLRQAHATFVAYAGRGVAASEPAVIETTGGESDSAGNETPQASNIDDIGFTLPDKDGNLVSLTDFKGKTIIINFFGTWCYYCNEELPGLQAIHDERDDVKVLLIAAPGVNGEGDIDYVEEYMEKAGYSMDILYDTTLQTTSLYGISGYPTSFFVKPDGTYLYYVPGYVDEEMLDMILAEAKK